MNKQQNMYVNKNNKQEQCYNFKQAKYCIILKIYCGRKKNYVN